jgi:hypothetical protein
MEPANYNESWEINWKLIGVSFAALASAAILTYSIYRHKSVLTNDLNVPNVQETETHIQPIKSDLTDKLK